MAWLLSRHIHFLGKLNELELVDEHVLSDKIVRRRMPGTEVSGFRYIGHQRTRLCSSVVHLACHHIHGAVWGDFGRAQAASLAERGSSRISSIMISVKRRMREGGG